eukprot:SRR837773.24965.p2 GENE.SRR837773.24965~~SRR837773.24965.p2  ORF type:complete len:141 (+),score=9.56 SRR837773.24965:204-626(+)
MKASERSSDLRSQISPRLWEDRLPKKRMPLPRGGGNDVDVRKGVSCSSKRRMNATQCSFATVLTKQACNPSASKTSAWPSPADGAGAAAKSKASPPSRKGRRPTGPTSCTARLPSPTRGAQRHDHCGNPTFAQDVHGAKA